MIDAVLVYSTCLGGVSADYGYGIAVDRAGNACIRGHTESCDFPLVGDPYRASYAGDEYAFVPKINAAGSALVCSTYLGGNADDGKPGLDDGGITVDKTGNAYVAGFTSSGDFALAGSLLQSAFGGGAVAFVAKIGVSFTDVSATEWAYPYILAIQADGIPMGCSLSPPLFCPSQAVTREQMAAFILRAVEGEPPADYCGTTNPFNDVSYSSPYCGYIKRLVELGIMQGTGNGNYSPSNPVLRDQMAAFLARGFLGMQ